MTPNDLSEKEKIVLYHLVRHPTLNDRELSEKIGLKISTLTSIKNRLRKADYYKTIRIPDLSFLGYEIMWIRYGSYNPVKDPDEIYRHEKDLIAGLGLKTFYSVQDGHSFFSLNIARNFTEAQTHIRAIEKEFKQQGLTEEFNYIFLPLDLTTNLFNFDYSMLLKNTFGIDDDWYFRLPGNLRTGGCIDDLKPAEVQILKSLIRNPELPDTAVATQIDTTRQAVSRLRKKFERDGVLRTARIPNIAALGYEILVFSHQTHNPTLADSELLEVIEKHIISNIPLFYINSTELESFGLSVFSDFYQFQMMRELVVARTLRAGYISRVPIYVLLSIPNMHNIAELDFSTICP